MVWSEQEVAQERRKPWHLQAVAVGMSWRRMGGADLEFGGETPASDHNNVSLCTDVCSGNVWVPQCEIIVQTPIQKYIT